MPIPNPARMSKNAKDHRSKTRKRCGMAALSARRAVSILTANSAGYQHRGPESPCFPMIKESGMLQPVFVPREHGEITPYPKNMFTDSYLFG